MGGNAADEQAKAKATRTKERFQSVWRDIRASTDERWALGLRHTANLIGFVLFPIGWAWVEYPHRRGSKRMPYEAHAEKVSSLNIKLEEAETKAGTKAFQDGINARKKVVERHLMRMIKRQEIPVQVINYRMEGYPLDDKMRLDEALRFDVATNGIGLFDLKDGRGFSFQTDAQAVLAALEDKCAWNTNTSVNDWLVIERYLRELFEVLGLPGTRDEYANRTAIWYVDKTPTGEEPAKTELRNLTSKLFSEYADSEI
jgi:hypothetical protein